MAKNKNRNILVWAALGAIGNLVAYFSIAFITSLCPYCKKDPRNKIDRIHCGNCNKANKLSEVELIRLKDLRNVVQKNGDRIKVDGVKITLIQRHGAKLNFVGLESLEEYVQGI